VDVLQHPHVVPRLPCPDLLGLRADIDEGSARPSSDDPDLRCEYIRRFAGTKWWQDHHAVCACHMQVFTLAASARLQRVSARHDSHVPQ
jgi:hypothetical protein